MSDAIHHGDIDSVGNGVRPLDGSPGVFLCLAVLRFLRRVPPNGSGIKQNIGALQSREPRTLGVPLIPADQRAHLADRRVKRAKAQVARSEIKFFVIERVVRNVHLAIFAEKRSVRIENRAGVVINAGGTALE